jgi:hypothetical protein
VPGRITNMRRSCGSAQAKGRWCEKRMRFSGCDRYSFRNEPACARPPLDDVIQLGWREKDFYVSPQRRRDAKTRETSFLLRLELDRTVTTTDASVRQGRVVHDEMLAEVESRLCQRVRAVRTSPDLIYIRIVLPVVLPITKVTNIVTTTFGQHWISTT